MALHRYRVKIAGIEHEFQFESDAEAKETYPGAQRVRGGDVALSEPVGDVVPVVDEEGEAKRREAAEAYTGAGRPELAEQEEAELAILEAYLPAQLDDAELRRLATETVAELGVSGVGGMGQVMKALQPRIAGRAEGGRVAAAVRAALEM